MPQRAIPELTDAFPGYAHHPADLLQGPAVPVVQTEVEPEHLGIPRREGCQCSLQIVRTATGEGGCISTLLGQRNEPIQPPPILPFTNRLIQAERLDVEGAQGTNRLRSEPGGRNEFLCRGYSAQLLGQ